MECVLNESCLASEENEGSAMTPKQTTLLIKSRLHGVLLLVTPKTGVYLSILGGRQFDSERSISNQTSYLPSLYNCFKSYSNRTRFQTRTF